MESEPQSPTGVQPKGALSIRARLMILAVAATLPLIADRTYDLQTDRADRIQAASQQALSLAQQGMERHYDIIIAARAVLQALSRVYPTVAGDSQACHQMLAAMSKDLLWAKVVSIGAPNGDIRCSNITPPAGFNVANMPFFQEMLRTNGFVTSGFHVGRRTQLPVMYTGFALRGPDGAVQSTFAVSIDLESMGGLAKAIGKRTGATVLLLDGHGAILARHPDPEKFIGGAFTDHPLVRHILARPEGTVTETSMDGVRRIYGFVQLPGTNARLAIGFDESNVLRNVNRETLTAVAQLAIMAAVVLIGIWFGGERLFVRPLHALAQTAGRLGRGEPTTRAGDPPWAAEFVPLAAALGNVAEQLAARERDLRATAGRLQELAEIDSLTGLANRRAFDGRLDTEWQYAMQAEQPIALLMIDVDHFKLFNDHYGHVAGDSCLRTVGDALAAATRTGAAEGRRTGDVRADILARYGGEEFVVLLPSLDLEIAAKVAERLRATVEALAVAHAGAPRAHLTVSVGVAAGWPGPMLGARALIEAADAALYSAKRNGRNTVATTSLDAAPLAAAS